MKSKARLEPYAPIQPILALVATAAVPPRPQALDDMLDRLGGNRNQVPCPTQLTDPHGHHHGKSLRLYSHTKVASYIPVAVLTGMMRSEMDETPVQVPNPVVPRQKVAVFGVPTSKVPPDP